jgi:hypothetical protein
LRSVDLLTLYNRSQRSCRRRRWRRRRFVSDQADPAGITVFQVKYFPNGLKDSQKRQVRESFRHCRDNAQFGTREWILCVPLDLSQEEIAWFTQWSAKEVPALLPPARIDWWGETKLGHLLLQLANIGI